jgi:hypothetical protein
LVSLAGKDADFQSLSWATWATRSWMEKVFSGVTAKGTISFPISSGSLKMKKVTRKNLFL